MRYMIIVPFTDPADERPRAATKYLEAASEAAAAQIAEALSSDAPQLMDLAVCDWRDDEDWAGLDGQELLREAGCAFGAVEVWDGELLMLTRETHFGACDRVQGLLGPAGPLLAGVPFPA